MIAASSARTACAGRASETASARHDRGAALASDERRRPRDAAVREVRQQDLVAGAQRERAQDGVDAAAGVVDEDQAVAVDAENAADPLGRRAQARRLRCDRRARASSSRSMKLAGWRSISSRIALRARITACGATPTVP